MAYSLYMDGILFPVTPPKLKIGIKNQNKTLNLINEGEVNILKSTGLTEIQFDLMIPQVQYPFAAYAGGVKSAPYFLSHLEKLKTGKKPFQFILSRVRPGGNLLFDTNMKVSLEDYQISEDAKDGPDLTISIKLKQYRNYGTKTIVIEKAKAIVSTQRPSESAPTKKTYTVVKGDRLWNIAKKYLGDGARYTEIYALNKDKIKNPNLIYVGQVLTLP